MLYTKSTSVLCGRPWSDPTTNIIGPPEVQYSVHVVNSYPFLTMQGGVNFNFMVPILWSYCFIFTLKHIWQVTQTKKNLLITPLMVLFIKLGGKKLGEVVTSFTFYVIMGTHEGTPFQQHLLCCFHREVTKWMNV